MRFTEVYSRTSRKVFRFLVPDSPTKNSVFLNLIFPIFLLYFTPLSTVWILAIVVNFIVDSLVIWFTAGKFRKNFVKLWKKVFLKVYLFGWLADFLGVFSWLIFLLFIKPRLGFHFVISPTTIRII